MTNPLFRSVRRTMYALKRAYGQGLTICRNTGESTDFSTGAQTATQLIECNIRRAVVLPSKIATQWMHARPDDASERQFNFGSIFESSIRLILIARRDMPGNWPIDCTTFIQFNGKRYEVKKVMEYENQEVAGYLIDALSGAPISDATPATTVIVGPSIPPNPYPPTPPTPSTGQWIIQLVDAVLTALDANNTYSTKGATGSVAITLPNSGNAGDTIDFVCEANQTLSVVAPAGQTITNGTQVGTTMSSNLPTSTATLRRSGATTWVVTSSQGQWDTE